MSIPCIRSFVLLRHALLPAILVAALTTHAAAQATWVVGPAGFAEINAALAVAQHGDIIEIEPGAYEPFACDVGVTIRAQHPGTVMVVPVIGNGECVADAPASETVNFADLSFSCGLRVVGGRVAMSNCSMSASVLNVIYVLNATIHLVGCDIFQQISSTLFTAAALRADYSDVTAVDCEFNGGPPLNFTEGVFLSGSRMHASGVTLSGNSAQGFGGGLSALNGSTVWLTDSVASSAFGCPLRSFNGSQLYVENVSTFGSTTGNCTAGTAKSMLAVSQPAPLTAGAPFQLHYAGQPNSFLAVFASVQLGTVNWGPFLDQPSWLNETSSFAAALVVTDAAGQASVSWPIPAGAAITGKQLWFKGVNGLSLPLQASAVAGGVAR